DYGRKLQLRFFNHFLKGSGDWLEQPRVQLLVRHVDKFVERHENEWPIARTQWTKLYPHPGAQLQPVPGQGTVAFDAMGAGITFISEPLPRRRRSRGRLPLA